MASPVMVRRRPPALLLFAFFLSGAASLVYQVLWTRRLGLVFGVTIEAASTVLACFMAGLAIGSYVAGRRVAHLKKPLLAFAAVEAAIGLAALLTPWTLDAVEAGFAWLGPLAGDSSVGRTLLRIALAAPALVVPATLMGATYPLLLHASVRARHALGSGASLLYGVNTSGAIAGVLLGSLWLVPEIGLRMSFVIAATINLLVALLAWVVSRRELPTADQPNSPLPTEDNAQVVTRLPSLAGRRAVLVVLTLSGIASLALEIIWFRIMVFFLRPTTYAFASMLGCVLVGIAAGSLLVTPLLRRRRDWFVVLASIELAIGLLGLLSAIAMVRSYDVMEWMWTWNLRPPFDYIVPLVTSAAVAIVPTSMLFGAAFPLGVLLWAEGRGATGDVGRRVGVLYAWNVGGAIVGSLLAGFVLLPLLGSQRSLVLVTALPLMSGLALWWLSGHRLRTSVIAGALLAFGAIAATLPDMFNDVVTRRYRGHEILWHREDAQTSVAVVERGGVRTLLIDGMHHASDGRAMTSGHEIIGTMGMLIHGDARRGLVIGLGGGSTGGSLGTSPSMVLDVVELSPSVIQANEWFTRTNHGILKNPRARFRVDDGRNFLRTTRTKYDVIVADLLLPEMAGAANLYSADYYEFARRALSPRGLMVQWIPADREDRYTLMLRTFLSVFPHVTTWRDGSIVVGSNAPIRLDRAGFERLTQHAKVRELLAPIGLGEFQQLADTYLGGREEALAFVGPGPILEDDRPVIEYFLSMPRTAQPPDTNRLRGPRAAVLPD